MKDEKVCTIEREVEGMPPGTKLFRWKGRNPGDILEVPHGYFDKPMKIAGWECFFVGFFGLDREPQARHSYKRAS